MKRLALPILLATGLLAQIAGAQTSSSTPVIGYYKQTINPGNNPVVCGFTTKKDFQGAMTSNTPGTPNSDINQTGAGWTINQFQTAGGGGNSSHFVEILSGPNAGLILDIVSNTAASVTVEGNITGLVGGTDTYCIRKHVTLGSLLAGGGGLSAGGDSVIIVNSDASASEYVYNGGNWEDVGTLDDGTNKVIYPGQGFIIRRGGNTQATITVGGNEVSYVKSGPTKVPLFHKQGNQIMRNYVGAVNPLVSDSGATDVVPLGNFGLVAGLNPGSDSVDVFSLTGNFQTLATYVSNGGNLEDVGSLDDGTNVPIRNGSAFRVIVPGNTDRLITLPQTTP